MTWFDVMKISNIDVARHILAETPENNPHENYDVCCEYARKEAENQIREWGETGEGILASPKWKNYDCDNLRRELEFWADMDMPGIQQIIDAWNKCAERGDVNGLV